MDPIVKCSIALELRKTCQLCVLELEENAQITIIALAQWVIMENSVKITHVLELKSP